MADLKMLAIDLGASSGRGIVGTFDGEKLTLRENHRFSNDPMFVNGRFTWDILRIYFEIKNSITMYSIWQASRPADFLSISNSPYLPSPLRRNPSIS